MGDFQSETASRIEAIDALEEAWFIDSDPRIGTESLPALIDASELGQLGDRALGVPGFEQRGHGFAAHRAGCLEVCDVREMSGGDADRRVGDLPLAVLGGVGAGMIGGILVTRAARGGVE